LVKSNLLYVFLEDAICNRQTDKQSCEVYPRPSVAPNFKNALTAKSKHPVSIYYNERILAK
jgi:hypothetical protein